MPDQNPPTSSSDAGHQQSADGSVDVPTEVTSGGTLADNARLEHQPLATISYSCIDVSTSDHNPVVDSSAENVRNRENH